MSNFEFDGGVFDEFTATWFEQRIFPENKDYFQYLPSLTKYSINFALSSNDSSVGY